MLRSSFHQHLEDVKDQITRLGEEVLIQFDKSLEAFEQSDRELIDHIIQHDAKVNKLELDINNEVFQLIARQQPVATDLRNLIVAMKISGDLERVGDLAVDLAKVSKRIDPSSYLEKKQELLTMAGDARSMLKESLEAFKTKNLIVAQKMAALDDKVDEQFGRFIKRLFKDGTTEHDAEQLTQLAFIARYIERIADYATNVAEWVIYESNGEHFDLN
ncbi:phosphate signaling complex protein PhoU [Alkalicoccobacillus porphyridii]|uniref:Phosphate-specific transport system accessory protein PhoU n=1 Tax=Alkalicoccobacillus porphyridii TaxID=2597270 RepID=A0A553ZXU3_9BACI|nr:phosphate signaling complex protein PhoU [Alkalicoccobacillus porphyridii]TSB46176.1 phosphate signaling complex protein PhoU [Alkalicoccobacillus porphyridii]